MKSQRGAYTVEAVIVMSTIIFIIFAIISAFLLIYQNAVMYYVASSAAQEGSIMWTDMSVDLDGNTGGTDEQGPYYRIGELTGGGGSKEKTETIKKWAEQKLEEMTPNTIIGSGKETVNVKFDDYVIARFITVSISKEIDIPFREVAKYFNKDLDLKVSVKAAVSEPAEYIRNIDYGIELATTIWNDLGIGKKFGKILDLMK